MLTGCPAESKNVLREKLSNVTPLHRTLRRTGSPFRSIWLVPFVSSGISRARWLGSLRNAASAPVGVARVMVLPSLLLVGVVWFFVSRAWADLSLVLKLLEDQKKIKKEEEEAEEALFVL